MHAGCVPFGIFFMSMRYKRLRDLEILRVADKMMEGQTDVFGAALRQVRRQKKIAEVFSAILGRRFSVGFDVLKF